MCNVEERLRSLRRRLELGGIVELFHMGLERLRGFCQSQYRTKVGVITGQSVQLSRERSLEGSTVSAATRKSAEQDLTNTTQTVLTGDVFVASERSSDLGLVRELDGVRRGGRE